MATNLKDIAELAGVSTATVSRALNNPETVSNSTRKKIESVIAATDYTPNINAKRLRSQKAHSVLVVSPGISDPFCAKIVQGVENTAAELSYAVLLGDTQGDSERARIFASMVRSGHVDGLLYFGIRRPYELPVSANISQRDLPMVNICNYTATRLPNVGIDNVAAARLAVNHLIRLGHRRIAVIAGLPDHPETLARLQGYRDALSSYGLQVSDNLIAFGDFSFESGITACNELLAADSKPTAIFCHNDRMGLGAVQALWHKGMRVPNDMSIVSFDDLEFARFSCPPLTTIAQPMYEIGAHAMNMLHDIMQGKELHSYTELLPVKLIVRESTAPLAAASASI
jgi:LacI family repressor for deo operon, udp, cdd, tsx, nupC, and nupG